MAARRPEANGLIFLASPGEWRGLLWDITITLLIFVGLGEFEAALDALDSFIQVVIAHMLLCD